MEYDGQIEAAGVLGKIGRSQVDDCPSRVPLIAKIGQRSFDPMNALADTRLRQPNQNGLGKAARRIDLNGEGIDSDQGEGTQLGKHGRGTQGLMRR